MMWRVALAATAFMGAVDVTPAAAQSWDNGGRPFWESPRDRGWRNDPYEDDWYRGDDNGDGYGRQADIRSGGARPVIYPKAPPRIHFQSTFAPNSIVIDSAGRKLYFILSGSEAYAYPISVGREGFAWTGTEVISREQEWPDWNPPKEMIARDPRVPDKMTGGIKNPLGAMALYLGNTLYRIHGTNDPTSIGKAASSGCFRMMNENVLHLASIAPIGTPVTVLKHLPNELVAAPRPAQPPAPARQTPRYTDPRDTEPPDIDPRDDDPRDYDPRDDGWRNDPYDRYYDRRL